MCTVVLYSNLWSRKLIFQYGNETAVTTYKESSLWLCNKCSFLLCRGWGISVSITEKVILALVDYLMALWLFNYSSIGGIAWRKVDSAKSANQAQLGISTPLGNCFLFKGRLIAWRLWSLLLLASLFKNRASWYLFTLGSLLPFFKGRLISCKLWNLGYYQKMRNTRVYKTPACYRYWVNAVAALSNFIYWLSLETPLNNSVKLSCSKFQESFCCSSANIWLHSEKAWSHCSTFVCSTLCL